MENESHVPNSPVNQSVEQLHARQEAFVRLFAHNEPLLRGFILAMAPAWDDAAEILQETSVVAWRKFDEFELGTHFHSWICRIAAFEVHNFRARSRSGRLQFNNELLDQIAEMQLGDTEYLEEHRRALTECMGKLRESDRQLILDRYTAQRSGKQIAELRRQPADSIYKALSRIRAALYDCINRTLAREEHG